MNVEIISIGTEYLQGMLEERNAGFLGCLFMNKYHINYHAYSNASYN